MPNNSVEDRYNPSGNREPDYEPVRFDVNPVGLSILIVLF